MCVSAFVALSDNFCSGLSSYVLHTNITLMYLTIFKHIAKNKNICENYTVVVSRIPWIGI